METFRRALHARDGGVFQAVNKVPPNTTLHLFTRFLLENPCSTLAGNVIRTQGMVGCFLSHTRVLEEMKPGDVYGVFEEDARFLEGGERRLQELLPFVEKGDFHFLKLQALSHDPAAMPIQQLSPSPSSSVQLEFCDGKQCFIEGAMGYIVTFAGAQLILKHAGSLFVQFDSLVSLVDNYEPEFKMYWTHPSLLRTTLHTSTVQEACVWKSIAEYNTLYTYLWLGVWLQLAWIVCIFRRIQRAPVPAC